MKITKLRFFLLVAIITFLFPINSFAKVSKETEGLITFDDVQLEPGKVDLNNLPLELEGKFKKRQKEIDQYFSELGKALAKLEEMELKSKIKVLTFKEQQEYMKLLEHYIYLDENSLEIAGIEKVEDDSIIGVHSLPSDASMTKPTLYWENDMRMYVMTGRWSWNKTYPDGNTGGLNGFGLRINQEKISIFDHGLRTYSRKGRMYTPVVYPNSSSYGLGMRFQDERSIIHGYNAYSGMGWVYFNFYNGTPQGKTINVNTTYSHTWNRTSVTGFSIGSSSFGISWSHTNNKWTISNYNYISF